MIRKHTSHLPQAGINWLDYPKFQPKIDFAMLQGTTSSFYSTVKFILRNDHLVYKYSSGSLTYLLQFVKLCVLRCFLALKCPP